MLRESENMESLSRLIGRKPIFINGVASIRYSRIANIE